MFGKTGFIASLLVLGAMVMASVNLPAESETASDNSAAVAAKSQAQTGNSMVNRFAPPGASSAPGIAAVPASPRIGGGVSAFHPAGPPARGGAMPPSAYNGTARRGFVGHPFTVNTTPGGGIPQFTNRPNVTVNPNPDADSDSDSDSDSDMNDQDNNDSNDNDNDNSAIDAIQPYALNGNRISRGVARS